MRKEYDFSKLKALKNPYAREKGGVHQLEPGSGGIAATNYSSGSKCLVAIRARIALEEIGLIKL